MKDIIAQFAVLLVEMMVFLTIGVGIGYLRKKNIITDKEVERYNALIDRGITPTGALLHTRLTAGDVVNHPQIPIDTMSELYKSNPELRGLRVNTEDPK